VATELELPEGVPDMVISNSYTRAVGAGEKLADLVKLVLPLPRVNLSAPLVIDVEEVPDELIASNCPLFGSRLT